MFLMESQIEDKKIANLQKQIDDLTQHLKPDQLAKSIDQSYLSVGNLRAFLQILSIILTIFVTGAFTFGYIGFTNIWKIREEANKISDIRKSTEDTLSQVSNIKKQVEATVVNVEETIPILENRTNKEMDNLQKKLIDKFDKISNKVEQIEADLRYISKTFNKLSINKQNILNAREQQLLILLAKEIDPDNPKFSYNAAHMSLLFQRYDEALAQLNITLNSSDIDADLRKKAVDLKDQIEKQKSSHPVFDYPKAKGGMAMDGYFVVQLSANILYALVQNGYLSATQAQEIMNSAKSN
jgi:hypothetical protein